MRGKSEQGEGRSRSQPGVSFFQAGIFSSLFLSSGKLFWAQTFLSDFRVLPAWHFYRQIPLNPKPPATSLPMSSWSGSELPGQMFLILSIYRPTALTLSLQYWLYQELPLRLSLSLCFSLYLNDNEMST